MTTYVLVHGAWHGSWCWKRVRRALAAEGHDVFTPTLSGLGERSHLLSEKIDLETHVMDVVNLVRWEELSDVVLCGHSYGGIVVTGAADRLADRVRSLVYLDAFVPDDGESLMDLLPDDQREMQKEAAAHSGGWQVPPIPAEVFRLNARDNDWVNAQCTAQPMATLTQGVRLTGAIEQITDITYIRATGFEEGSPFPPFESKARQLGWTVVRVDAGHDVMLDSPEELSNILLALPR